MSDEVKVIFTGDASPLFAAADKVEARVKQVNANVGEVRNSNTGEIFASVEAYRASRQAAIEADTAIKSATASSVASTVAKTVETAATTGLAASSQAAAVATTETAAANVALTASSTTAAGALGLESAAATQLAASLIGVDAAILPLLAPLAAVASVIALGVAAVAISEKIKSQASDRLAIEESIAGALNKQAISFKQTVEDYKQFLIISRSGGEKSSLDITSAIGNDNPKQLLELKALTLAENERNLARLGALEKELVLSESLAKNAKARSTRDNVLTGLGLVNEFTESQKRQFVGNAEAEVERIKNTIKQINSELERGKENILRTEKGFSTINESLNSKFSSIGSNAISRAEAERSFQAEKIRRQEEFNESVARGVEKANQLAKSYQSVFAGVLTNSSSDNPFVSLYFNGEQALESFRESTRGLTADLRKQGEELIKQKNSLNTFNAQVSSAFESSDLREKARTLRDYSDEPTKVPKFEEANEALKKYAAGFRFNPFVAYDRATLPNGTETTVSRNILDNVFTQYNKVSSIGGESSGGSLATYRGFDDLTDDEKRSFLKQYSKTENKNAGAQERLDRQLTLASSFNTASEQEKGVIDKKIISVGSSLDPKTLRQDQRDKIAAALERQAERTERRETESLEIRRKMLTLTEEISVNQKSFIETANAGGLEAVESRITIIDGTNGNVQVSQNPKAPTQEDTKRQYKFDGFDILGGSNQ